MPVGGHAFVDGDLEVGPVFSGGWHFGRITKAFLNGENLLGFCLGSFLVRSWSISQQVSEQI